jgi:methylthioribose-1-phosphate isomerase
MRKDVDLVIVGADRIAGNGDFANKIGTFEKAVLAKELGIPFYVAAPTSTIDPSLASGDDIVIEERRPEGVTHFKGIQIAVSSSAAVNPAFDVTPHQYVTAIVTEKGIIGKPYLGPKLGSL